MRNIDSSRTRRYGTRGAGTQWAWIPLFAVLLSGCAYLGLDSEDSEQTEPEGLVAAELDPLVDFMSMAQNGEAAVLEDPSSGAPVRVLAGRRYQSASGKLCRRFAATTPPGYAGFNEGLACRDDEGRWTLSEMIVNPEDLTRPR